MSNKTKTLIILGFWLVLALLFVAANEKVFLTGDEIRLKVKPVDPRDLLRGQYVRLDYDISKVDVKKSEDFKTGQSIYTVLKEDGKTHTTQRISTIRPKDKYFIRGQIDHIQWNYRDNKKDYKTLDIKYGIENLFTKEKEAREIEKRLANGGIAVIKLDKQGNAKILRVE